MSQQSWPWYATRVSDNTKVTPLDGAANRNATYRIGGFDVYPAVGEQNRPHWRSKDGLDYARPAACTPREMSEWHSQQIQNAIDAGYEDEYYIPNSNPLMIADAYDAKTNIVFEYVWSHDDLNKVHQYFDLGYNQIWVFAEAKYSKWKHQAAYIKQLSVHTKIRGIQIGASLSAALLNIPTIGVQYD